jgi:peptide-methionine (S)-S-oxide reductase
MLKVHVRSGKRKSKSLALLLPRCVALALSVTFCSQALASQSNVAYFAGGCFWCTEAVFQQAPGVTSVVSGYMRNAETIQITFDSTKTSYDKLLNLFWRSHDPTQVDRQGPDIGKQYRSAIFYADEQQRQAAEKSKAQLGKSGAYSKPIATEITRAASFRSAPENHQNFCRRHPNNPYVRGVVVPKLEKLGLKRP